MKKVLYIILFISLFSSKIYSDDDPWRLMNENTHNFNESIDKIISTPIAKAYLYVTPDILEIGVSNFISNVEDVSVGINNILQGNISLGFSDFCRVIVNSSIGVGGLFDIASKINLEKHDEDFGQTLAVWGVSSGPYLVIPGLGPSTLRDAFGIIPDSFVSPTLALDDNRASYTYTAIDVIETRARYLGLDTLIIGNKYLFLKNAYLQKRDFEINNGEIEDTFDDFEELDFE